MKVRSFYMGKLAWPDVQEFLKEHKTVVIPVGSFEQHGPHLPLETDAHTAFYVCVKAAEKAGCALVVPPISYGVSTHHMDFPGTITLSNHTLEQVIFEIAASLVKHGFKKIIIHNRHGGNSNAVGSAANRIKMELGAFVVVDDIGVYGLTPDFTKKYIETPFDIHAGEKETSAVLATQEEWVVKDRITKPTIKQIKMKYNVIVPFRTKEVSDTGVIGDPTKATKEKGEIYHKMYIERLAELIREVDCINI
jgi:creatinine amidohydrolase